MQSPDDAVASIRDNVSEIAKATKAAEASVREVEDTSHALAA
jgi:hypothetical protein